MGWWGKVIGGAVGFALGGPLGALLGAAFGHQWDGRPEAKRGGRVEWVNWERSTEQELIQSAFFTATFSVMGHLAKADGRVSEQEIQLAKQVMAQMNLSEEQQRTAKRLFTEGKQRGFPLDEVLDQLRRECLRRHTLLQVFLEIQMQFAYADGAMDAAEQQLLLHIFERLGFSRREFDHIDLLVRAAYHFAGGERTVREGARRNTLNEAYGVLGIKASASDAEVKRAYKRLMNQHHPDKLVAKGLPEEMIKLANEKSQEIRAAYEQVKEVRGMR
ncbi:MAG TPA: co-chaperone DjlA [Gammaproteobacteria bacterium]